ncbi:MAG: SDR family NAD(P)-dependent oxidoreductase, partial [Rhodospirillaceae bacterium]|nr:SDR family NAD(P)-dependent oxidoreductase [Rhodospirillaceae bacterium]
MAELDGRRALITGAGRGMGRAHAMVMAAQGAAVVVQDIDGDLANQTAALVREQGGAVEVMVGDISDVT